MSSIASTQALEVLKREMEKDESDFERKEKELEKLTHEVAELKRHREKTQAELRTMQLALEQAMKKH